MTEQQLAKNLRDDGLLSTQQIQAAAQKRHEGRPFAQAVVEMGYLTSDQVKQIHPGAFDGPASSENASVGSADDAPKPAFAFRAEDKAEIVTGTGSRSAANVSGLVQATIATANGAATNGQSNGNGHSNGHANGHHPNGSSNGHSNGNGNGTHKNGSHSNGSTPHSNGRTPKTAPAPAASTPAPSTPAAAPLSTEEIGLGQDEIAFLADAEVFYDGEDILGQQDDARGPTVHWCNELLKIAVQTRSSDMHLEPRPNGLLPRYRIDGHLRPGQLLPREYMAAVISRFKVLGQLDIAENRLPQDGRFRATVGGRVFDFRVSTLPGMHGEKVVLRLLDRTSLVTDLTRLGFTGEDAGSFQEMLERSHGMILVTGPTGSGKTTTLYAALAAANDESKNVITVEDPVEYELEGVTQCKVQPGIGLTFAAQLRAILRQDPDVILVGEIRDGDTADIAIRAALTGHLVLSTLHTNSAVGAVTRLQDMGVAPFLIASSMSGVIAQRLVRMICRHCRIEMEEDDPKRLEAIERLKLSPETILYQGAGCPHCNQTGMRGRLALVELLQIDSAFRKAVMAKADAGELRGLAMKSGMKSLWQDGIEKLEQGLTTGQELIRVLMGHDEEE